eukprot:365304-Chlamydomonas_euryale.AAC.7
MIARCGGDSTETAQLKVQRLIAVCTGCLDAAPDAAAVGGSGSHSTHDGGGSNSGGGEALLWRHAPLPVQPHGQGASGLAAGADGGADSEQGPRTASRTRRALWRSAAHLPNHGPSPTNAPHMEGVDCNTDPPHMRGVGGGTSPETDARLGGVDGVHGAPAHPLLLYSVAGLPPGTDIYRRGELEALMVKSFVRPPLMRSYRVHNGTPVGAPAGVGQLRSVGAPPGCAVWAHAVQQLRPRPAVLQSGRAGGGNESSVPLLGAVDAPSWWWPVLQQG